MKAKLFPLAVVILVLAGCGSGKARVSGSSRPMANVLVYAKAPQSNDVGAKESVWKAHVDGRHPKLIARNSTDPAVSPDGRLVAYDKGGNVLVVPTSGGKPTIVYRFGGYPAWAPDSRHLAVSAGIGSDVIVNVRTGDKTAIVAPPLDGIDVVSFSPDSTRVVYGAESPTGGDLYVASVALGRTVRITNDHLSFSPVWGPNGIAFVRNQAHDWHGDVWLTGPRPNDARQLTHTGTPIWPQSFSGDGTELLGTASNGGLWAVDVPTGRARAIDRGRGALAQGFSRDGKTALAAVGCGGDYAGPHYGVIETIPFAGGKPHIITRGPCGASWNADY
jgi:Tol biopolymer transport system component